jgi:dihydrofolate reductase
MKWLAKQRKNTMGRVIVHEFSTLDARIEEPRWSMSYPFDPRMGNAIGEIMGSCTALLLGRITYEMFAPAWSKRTAEQDPGAPFMNESKKYVVSSTLRTADWNNSEFIGPYDAQAIQKLKDQEKGNLYVSGSVTLVQAMLADGLVDELHLFQYPLALGTGKKLFAEGIESKFALDASQTYSNGVVYLVYKPAAG